MAPVASKTSELAPYDAKTLFALAFLEAMAMSSMLSSRSTRGGLLGMEMSRFLVHGPQSGRVRRVETAAGKSAEENSELKYLPFSIREAVPNSNLPIPRHLSEGENASSSACACL